MRQRVLLTGGSGLLALNWAVAIRDRFSVVLGLHQRKVVIDGAECIPLDLKSVDRLTRSLTVIRPDIVIHAAGMTSVELCERDPGAAFKVNVELARNVASACESLSLPLVHISTDHLFRGDTQFCDETSQIFPLNAYGVSKAAAEREVMSTSPHALVVRTNFYGWGPAYRQSFSDWILESIGSGRKITLFDDVYYTPILVSRLAHTVHALVDSDAAGVFNVVGDSRMSKYEFGCRLACRFGLDASLISPGSIDASANLVMRPLDMSLSNRKASKFLGQTLGTVDEHLDILYQQRIIAEEFSTL